MRNRIFWFIFGLLLPLGVYWIGALLVYHLDLIGIGCALVFIIILMVVAFINRRKNSSFALGIMVGLWIPFLFSLFKGFRWFSN